MRTLNHLPFHVVLICLLIVLNRPMMAAEPESTPQASKVEGRRSASISARQKTALRKSAAARAATFLQERGEQQAAIMEKFSGNLQKYHAAWQAQLRKQKDFNEYEKQRDNVLQSSKEKQLTQKAMQAQATAMRQLNGKYVSMFADARRGFDKSTVAGMQAVLKERTAAIDRASVLLVSATSARWTSILDLVSASDEPLQSELWETPYEEITVQVHANPADLYPVSEPIALAFPETGELDGDLRCGDYYMGTKSVLVGVGNFVAVPNGVTKLTVEAKIEVNSKIFAVLDGSYGNEISSGKISRTVAITNAESSHRFVAEPHSSIYLDDADPSTAAPDGIHSGEETKRNTVVVSYTFSIAAEGGEYFVEAGVLAEIYKFLNTAYPGDVIIEGGPSTDYIAKVKELHIEMY